MPILNEVADIQKVDQEWRSHSMNPKLNEGLTPEEYWQVVFTEKRSASDHELARPNLVKVVMHLSMLTPREGGSGNMWGFDIFT
jgi:hypothetical protein